MNSSFHSNTVRQGPRLRILVLGYIVRFPLGGMTWHYLQYVLGLMKLGHEVYFLEDSDDYEECCYDPVTFKNSTDPSIGIAYAASVFNQYSVNHRWAYYDAHTSTWMGPSADSIDKIISSADLLINISGSNALRPWHMDVPVRVMIDTDPAFEQVRQLTVPLRREHTLRHTHFFTFGHGITNSTSLVPDDGLPWKFTRQPIVTDLWRVTDPPDDARFTTVMQWDSYPTRSYKGLHFGMKSESFSDFMSLPRLTRSELEVAVCGRKTPRDQLHNSGWKVVDSQKVTLDPKAYQKYISNSKAEFSIAKHGYVAGRTGWFSERSACYLASGRPVLAQDTGFSDWLPIDTGLVAFNSVDEALAGIEEIEMDYPRHSKAARELAVSHFGSGKVLQDMLDDID